MAEYQSISHAKYDIKYQSTEPGALESSAISEGTKFEVVAGGIFAIEEEVLGTASLGSRLFLCDSRECNGRNDQGIHREARRNWQSDNSARRVLVAGLSWR